MYNNLDKLTSPTGAERSTEGLHSATPDRRRFPAWTRWMIRLGLPLFGAGLAFLIADHAYQEELDALQSSIFIVTTRSLSGAQSAEPLQVNLEYDARERRAQALQVSPSAATGRVGQYEFSVPPRGLQRVALQPGGATVELVRILDPAGATISRSGRDKFRSMQDAAPFRSGLVIALLPPPGVELAREWIGVDPLPTPAGPSRTRQVGGWTALYAVVFIGLGWLIDWLLERGRLSDISQRHSGMNHAASLALVFPLAHIIFAHLS